MKNSMLHVVVDRQIGYFDDKHAHIQSIMVIYPTY